MPGSYFTASDIASQLEEQNRISEGYKTWRQMYGAVDLAKQREMSTLKYDTEKSMADAYAEAYAAKQAVADTNYFDAYKETLDKGINTALAEAYDSYIKNYEQSAYNIEEQAQNTRDKITSALTSESESYAALANKPYEYLQYLYDIYYNDDAARKQMLEKGVDWSNYDLARFLTDEIDPETGKPYVDEEGNLTGQKVLKSWDQLAAELFTVNQETDERVLNQAGIDFYDMMLNNPYYSSGMTSFDEWLSQNDSDLYDWYTSYNPYTVAEKSATDKNTYGGSAFRQFIGLKSTDRKYSMLERWGGMSKEQLDDQLKGITNRIEELNKIDLTASNSKEILEGSKNLITELRDVTKKLGVENELNKELEEAGISWDTIETSLAKSLEDYENPAGTFFKELGIAAGIGTASGAAIGAVPGAVFGSLVPVIGTGMGAFTGGVLGAAVGAIGGLLTGIITGSIGTTQAKERNKISAEQARKLAIDSVYQMTAQMQNMRAKSQE